MTEPAKQIRKKRAHVELRVAAQTRASHMEIAQSQEGNQISRFFSKWKDKLESVDQKLCEILLLWTHKCLFLAQFMALQSLLYHL